MMGEDSRRPHEGETGSLSQDRPFPLIPTQEQKNKWGDRNENRGYGKVQSWQRNESGGVETESRMAFNLLLNGPSAHNTTLSHGPFQNKLQ